MFGGLDQKPPRPSVLTSDVHNEAETIFHILEHKDHKAVSQLDCVTLLRGMGMNPVQADMDRLHETMAPLVAELDEMRLEEERRREKERRREEAKKGGAAAEKAKKEAAEKAKKEKEAAEKAAAAAAAAEGAEGEGPKKKVLSDPPEEIKNIDWHIFVSCVEPMYKDNRQEEREIVAALSVFDPENTGRMSMKQLIDVCTHNGESVLSPAEVKQLQDAFPGDGIDFTEFAQKIQGTWRPPPPPTAEEIAAAEAETKRLADEKRKSRLVDVDALLSGDADAPAAAPAA